MRFFALCLLMLAVVASRAAVPTFQSFEPTQFDTNALSIKYNSVFTNDLGQIHPAQVNDGVTVTNFTHYGALVLPDKVTLLTLGTNVLNMATNSAWLLYSPTNDAAQVVLSLTAGAFQGQLAFIQSQNSDGAFTLHDLSEQDDVPGAFVDISGDWIATTNRGILLRYAAPDWVEASRADPSSTNGPFGGAALWASSSGNLFPSPAVGVVSITSTLTNNTAAGATNDILVLDTVETWTSSPNENRMALFRARTGGQDRFMIGTEGGIIMFPNAETYWGNTPQIGEAFVAIMSPPDGDENYIVWDMEVIHQQGVNQSAYSFSATTNTLNADMSLAVAGTLIGFYTSLNAVDPNQTFFRFESTNGTSPLLFKPAAAATVTPYLLGTPLTHTSGNLVEVPNNTTNKFTLDYAGNAFFAGTVSIGSLTNTLYRSGTELRYTNSNSTTTFVSIENAATNSTASGGSKFLLTGTDATERTAGTLYGAKDQAWTSTASTQDGIIYGQVLNDGVLLSPFALRGKYLTLEADNIGGLPLTGTGLYLQNIQVAAAGAQQVSPSIEFRGQGWDADAASSVNVGFIMGVVPVQGNQVTARLRINGLITGGGASPAMELTDGGSLILAGGISASTKTITSADSPYTALSTDYLILADCTSGAITINLPAASAARQILNCKKIDSSGNAMTLDGSGGETIDDAATKSTTTQYANFTIQSDLTEWWIE